MRFLALALLLGTLPATATPVTHLPLCEVYFSPADHLAAHVAELMDEESERLLIASYDLSHQAVLGALLRAQARGVAVEIIVDEFALSHGELKKTLKGSGIPLYVWTASSKKKGQRPPIMHNKFCIFGNRGVWTGSYNFTYRGDSANRENAVFLKASEITRLYEAEFVRLRSEARSVKL